MLNILIAEDDSAVQNICIAALRQAGFQAIPASNGLEAIHAYLQRKSEIHLVISDIKMPEMGGVQLLREIYLSDPGAKVILMSGDGEPDLLPEEKSKVCAFIHKPFRVSHLVDVVNQCLHCKAAVSSDGK